MKQSQTILNSKVAWISCVLLAAAAYQLNVIWILFVPIAIPAVLLVLRFPIWVCLLFIVFSFFRIHEAIPELIPLRIPQLLALAALASLFWHCFISRQIELFWHPLMRIFSLFFFLVLIGAVLSTNRAESIAAITDTFAKIALMLFAISWLIRTPANFRLACWLMTAAGVFIGCFAIYNRLNGIGLVEGTRVTIGRNIGAMIGDPNDLALVLTFPLSFAVALFVSRHLKTSLKVWLALPAVIIISWAILCTQSRGGLLGMTAVTAVVMWYRIQNKWLVIGAGTSLLLALVLVAGISSRASGGATEDGIDESAMGRIYAWQAATNMALSQPLTGVGIDNFYANYYAYSPHWDGKNHAVHSTWFQILAETGVVGFLIFICLVVKTFRQALQNQRQAFRHNNPDIQISALALLAGLCSFCVSGTFLTQGFIWPLYILIALTIALNRYLSAAPQLVISQQTTWSTYHEKS
jgi:probable O-glycosylation ligase (exosortase A-associated)